MMRYQMRTSVFGHAYFLTCSYHIRAVQLPYSTEVVESLGRAVGPLLDLLLFGFRQDVGMVYATSFERSN